MIPFDGRHLIIAIVALVIGLIAGAIYGWMIRNEQKGNK
jgi:ABC-type xylose transport system permease subunit